MTRPGDSADAKADARFDDAMRALHGAAVANVSARTRVQLDLRLRAARSASRPSMSWRPAWGLALAGSLALVAVIAVRMRTPEPAASVPVVATVDRGNDSGDLVASLDETPDLYLWLASSDASGFVPERP